MCGCEVVQDIISFETLMIDSAQKRAAQSGLFDFPPPGSLRAETTS